MSNNKLKISIPTRVKPKEELAEIKKQECKTLKSKGKPKTIAELVERLEKLEEILGL